MSICVKLEYGESSDYLVKRFMRKFKKSDIIKNLLECRTYKKPSKKKREAEAKRQIVLKQLRKEREGQISEILPIKKNRV